MNDPAILRFEDFRGSRRRIQQNLFCEIDNDSSRYQVYELSAEGFSFQCPKNFCDYHRWQFLQRISIINGEGAEVISGAGTVVHVTEFDILNMQVGVYLTRKSLDRTITGKIRVPRRYPRIRIDAEITSETLNGPKEISGYVKDYSAFSVRICTPPAAGNLVREGETVQARLSVSDKTLIQSPSQVVRKSEDGSDLILKFIQNHLNVTHVESVCQAIENQRIISSTFDLMSDYTGIEDSFKALICDWRMFFSRLKHVLDQEENKNIYQSPNEQEIFLQGLEEKFDTVHMDLIQRLNQIASRLSQRESALYKSYFRENLNPFYRQSPFCCSVIDRDNGYLGDYETIKYFFQNPYTGNSMFGKLLNRLVMNFDAVTAHQERIQFLFERLSNDYYDNPDGFSFLSLGSGPGEEVIRFVGNNAFNRPVLATLLDVDAYALADFSERVQYFTDRHFTTELVNINILSLLKCRHSDAITRKYPLTYCAGLLDYFKTPICRRIVKYLLSHTEKGGKLIITNVHNNSESRFIMDYCGGWNIIHRDEAEMATMIPEGHRMEFAYDKRKANIFLTIYN